MASRAILIRSVPDGHYNHIRHHTTPEKYRLPLLIKTPPRIYAQRPSDAEANRHIKRQVKSLDILCLNKEGFQIIHHPLSTTIRVLIRNTACGVRVLVSLGWKIRSLTQGFPLTRSRFIVVIRGQDCTDFRSVL